MIMCINSKTLYPLPVHILSEEYDIEQSREHFRVTGLKLLNFSCKTMRGKDFLD